MKLTRGRKTKKYVGFLLAMVMLASVFCVTPMSAKAATVIRMGTVTASSLNMRIKPGTEKECTIIASFPTGTQGKILAEGKASNGALWYQMEMGGQIGWVSAAYIKESSVMVEDDVAYDAYLTQQGFPASYKPYLQALHAQYPNWVLKAQHISYDWNTVIANESKVGRNLVTTKAISSWKSMQSSAYNWETGEWYGFDGPSWVAASTEIIQYYMDPRNFLDSTNVFQFVEQRYQASAPGSAEWAQVKNCLESMVRNTYLAGPCDNSTYVDVIMDVAAQTGVSPYTIAAMLIQEQGVNGTGGCISGNKPGYEGIYNHFNIGAYPGTVSNVYKDGKLQASAYVQSVTRGLWYASGSGKGETSYGRPWNTKTKSILGGATHYGTGFVNIGQDTLYLKKFDVADKTPYTHQYMTNIQGAASEGKLMAGAYSSETRQTQLVFRIPVYPGMPESPCPLPTENSKFADISSSAWYFDAVKYAIDNNIFNGYGNRLFGPADNTQRQDFLVVLARYDGVNSADYENEEVNLADVSKGDYYYGALAWAKKANIITGYEDGRFGVGEAVTREQILVILHRYAMYKGRDVSVSESAKEKYEATYNDFSSISDFAEEASLWALEKGVIAGTTADIIYPTGNASRAEVAQMFLNMDSKSILK